MDNPISYTWLGFDSSSFLIKYSPFYDGPYLGFFTIIYLFKF